MSDKLKRAKSLASAKTTVSEKTVKIDSFRELINELKAINMSQQKTQESVTKSLNELSKVILLASEEGMDTTGIIEAINGLKDKLEKKANPMPLDYEIHFERDKNLLMKSGIRLTSVPKKLN